MPISGVARPVSSGLLELSCLNRPIRNAERARIGSATRADLFGAALGEKSREEFLPGFLPYALDGFLTA